VAARQSENSRAVYDHLLKKGYLDPETDELTAILQQPSAQQYHDLVNLMVKRGYGNGGPSLGQIFKAAGLTYATNDIAAVVDAAHRSGAVCLLAHPGRSDGYTDFNTSRFDELREEVVIDGIEVYYPKHSPEQVDLFRTYAEKHNLLISSGSDSHGTDHLPIKYAAELSRHLLERLGIQIQ